MKKRLHDKKAGIAILLALIVLAVIEIAFRLVVNHESMLDIASYNLGEQLTVIALAASILCFNAKGKDKLSYLFYAAWIGYFVIDQMYQLPKVLLDVVAYTAQDVSTSILVPVFYLVSILCIIALGVLLVKYMNNGSIHNQAFNTFSVVAILSILASTIVNVVVVISSKETMVLLSSIHNMHRLAMIFLFTFFAYDSAKLQLKRVKFSK